MPPSDKSLTPQRKSNADQELLKQISDLIPGILFHLKIPKDGACSIPFVCGNCYDLLGLKPEEVASNMRLILKAIPEADIRKLEEEIRQAVEENRHLSAVFRLAKPDGTTIWLRMKANPELLTDGTTLWNGLALDVTRLVEQKTELEQTQNLLRRMLDSLDDAVFIVGPPRRQVVRACNAAVKRIFGYSPGEITGRTTERLHVDRKRYEAFGRMSEPVLEKEGVFRTEYRMKRKDGTLIDTAHTVRNLYDDKGWQEGVVSVVRDITEAKKNSTALQTKQRELRRRTRELKKLNDALEVMLRMRDRDRRDMERNIFSNVEKAVLPLLEKIAAQGLSRTQSGFLDVVRANLSELTSPFTRRLSAQRLSPTELRVAELLKVGKTSKEIAHILNLSVHTVSFHRANIRKKLGLQQTDVNLKTHLQQLS